jgi:preprotein translocase subunit YajC
VDLVTILPLVLIAVVFYFLMIRPAKVRQKKQAETLAKMGPGTNIMTTAGIFGTVVANGDEVLVEISPGVIIRMLPAAIAKVIPVEDLEVAAPDEPEAPGAPGSAI